MGRLKNHREKWKSNRAFIAELPKKRADWAATVIFYTALHATDWLFASDGIKAHTSHKDRDSTMALSRYDSIREPYKVLKNVSWLARYDAAPAVMASLTVDKINKRLIGKYLAEVEKFVLETVDTAGEHTPKDIEWPAKS